MSGLIQTFCDTHRDREADTEKPVLICPYSFSTEICASFTCPVESTDTWDLGFKVSSEGLGPAGDHTHDPWSRSRVCNHSTISTGCFKYMISKLLYKTVNATSVSVA